MAFLSTARRPPWGGGSLEQRKPYRALCQRSLGSTCISVSFKPPEKQRHHLPEDSQQRPGWSQTSAGGDTAGHEGLRAALGTHTPSSPAGSRPASEGLDMSLSLTRWRRSKLTRNGNLASPPFPLSSLLPRGPRLARLLPRTCSVGRARGHGTEPGSVHARHQVPLPFSAPLKAQPEGTAFLHKPGWGGRALGVTWRQPGPRPPARWPKQSPALSPWTEPPRPPPARQRCRLSPSTCSGEISVWVTGRI